MGQALGRAGQERFRLLALAGLLGLWCGLCSMPTTSLAMDLNTLLENIQQTYERTKALTATFEQVATISSLNRQQLSSGHVSIEKPHSIRWEYTKPDPQTILYDGATFRIYTPKRRQMLQSQVDEQHRTNVALLFLAGMGKLRDAFEVTLVASPGPEGAPLRLTPRSSQAGFSELQITVNMRSFLVEKLLIHDSIGNVTEMRLAALESHAALPLKTFELVLPPDTEILTPTDFTGRQ